MDLQGEMAGVEDSVHTVCFGTDFRPALVPSQRVVSWYTALPVVEEMSVLQDLAEGQ